MARRTPLYGRHRAAGARLVEFAGWEMPLQYTTVREETTAVRSAAGVFDVSHMGRVEVAGRAAGAFLQELVTGDVAALPEGRAQYTLICRPDGGIVDDVVVFRCPGGRWWVVVNAARRDRDLAWMQERAPASVQLVDRTDEVALVAVQGPKACSLVRRLGLESEELPRFGIGHGRIGPLEVTASRTGYTGEDGLEIFVDAEAVEAVWDRLVEVGARPCGLAARDVCRLEAGLRLYGSDMDEQTNPYEAGLGWTVRLEKGSFCGREALIRLREAPSRQLVGLLGSGETIPRAGAGVSFEGRRIGAVTSGTYSFLLSCGIGMASVQRGSVEVGAEVQLDTRRGPGTARVVRLPFYRGSAASARS